MGFFDKILGKKDESSSPTSNPISTSSYSNNDPNIMFGHYIDANKNAHQLAKWDEANKLFNDKNYKDSFIAFLEYVGDPAEKNVTWKYQGSDVHFTLEQGSKIIKGIHNGESLTGQAELVEFEQPPIAVMRQVLTSNYQMRYAKFAIHENKIGIYFKSSAREASPTKLYHALKELALKADKNDDYLTEEFVGVKKVGLDHVPQANAEISEIKFKYWQKWSQETITFVNSVDKNSFTGIISYALLNLFYKADYLLSPQGHFLDELTRIQHIYWNKNDYRTNVEKNDDMIRDLKLLLGKPKEYFTGSFYSVKATFGLIPGSAQQTINDYILDCLKNTDWYVQNRYNNMELMIYEYTATYSLFNFGMFPAHYRLFNLQLQILNEDYFREIGFSVPYIKNGILNQQAIIKEIDRIIASEKNQYRNIAFLTSTLKFGTVYEFHYSFLTEIRFLNFNK